jgi:serine/threonine protein kinase
MISRYNSLSMGTGRMVIRVREKTTYRIVELLGQGGFGSVYRAWDINLDSSCALKENLDTTPDAQKQFRSEALILANLNHPNLPRVRDHFIISGQGQYLVMDYIEGVDLQELLDQQGGPLLEKQILPWIGQICDALTYLHNQNPPIIHRDIKPANIKITPKGKAVLVDFGIAKVYDPKLSTTKGARAVTPGYSPHEQYGKGKTDARTDIYAIGATLYTLLTGQEPVESIQRMVNDPLPPPEQSNPLISINTANAIRKTMQMDPARRYQSIATLKTNLFVSSPVLPNFPLSKPATTQSTKKTKLLPWIGGLAFLGFVIILGIVIIFFSTDLGKNFLGLFQIPSAEENTRTTRTIATSPVSSSALNADVLFQDDFSDTSSGWDRVNETEGITDYQNGVYRILVNTASFDVWTNPGLNFTDTVIEVEATKVGGPDDNDFGVICRYQDINNFYFFVISSDGYSGIAKVVDGEQELIGMDNMEYSDAINQGNATNEIRAECVGDGLILSINGQTLMNASDPDYTSGDVGVIAGTFDTAGTDIQFDNFVVKKP